MFLNSNVSYLPTELETPVFLKSPLHFALDVCCKLGRWTKRNTIHTVISCWIKDLLTDINVSEYTKFLLP